MAEQTRESKLVVRTFTIRKYAALHQVAPSTVRRWIAKGAVVVRRTPGGQIRIIERVDETLLIRAHL
ncbi:MAG: MerR family DNA-binding transcriptional regulator [Acidobacteria bacterium]|nr:MerR family DNA-binding transcriptional regulator [Acidobacteriota bacterium]